MLSCQGHGSARLSTHRKVRSIRTAVSTSASSAVTKRAADQTYMVQPGEQACEGATTYKWQARPQAPLVATVGTSPASLPLLPPPTSAGHGLFRVEPPPCREHHEPRLEGAEVRPPFLALLRSRFCGLRLAHPDVLQVLACGCGHQHSLMARTTSLGRTLPLGKDGPSGGANRASPLKRLRRKVLAGQLEFKCCLIRRHAARGVRHRVDSMLVLAVPPT